MARRCGLPLVCLWALCCRGAAAAEAGQAADAPGAALSACGKEASPVVLEGPKVTRNYRGAAGGPSLAFWSFDPPADNFSISVTPTNSSMDPDVRLAAESADGSCHVFVTAQDYGGDTILLGADMKDQLHATKYYLAVSCRSPGCEYHIAFVNRVLRGEAPQEIRTGETKSGIAYHGVPVRFVYECKEECELKDAAEGAKPRLTFSAWPRDATSAAALTLLVRKDEEPTSASGEHLPTTRGWFSGRVAGAPAAKGKFHIVVLKSQGRGPLPFVLSVRLPETLERLPLGKPVFGSVSKDQAAFYRFEVTSAATDIEVYLTKLDGDPDLAMSHGEVNVRPTPLAAQWQSRKAGDDEIVVLPSDPKRQAHPIGWFHVGVHGYGDSAFSLIALAETHVEPDSQASTDTRVIDWTELWLGLPQSLSAQPGRGAGFLFYSQLATPRLFVNLEALEGARPDACVVLCGTDPHVCPYVSPFAAQSTLATQPANAIATCAAGTIQGERGDKQATIDKPCSSCWYAILVTSKTGRSKFRMLLGAEGRAHPLVAGEAFRGHVDANDTSVLLVYDLSAEAAAEQGRGSSTLRAVLTPVYGDPVFEVHNGSEDGQVLFSSATSGRDDYELGLTPQTAPRLAGLYYFVVRALTKHAQFRFQVSWSRAAGDAADTGGEALLPHGLPVLVNGEAQKGVLLRGRPDVYLFLPPGSGRPGLRFSAQALSGRLGCRLHATALPKDVDAAAKLLVAVARWPATEAQWHSTPGSPVLIIGNKDKDYVAPGPGTAYAVVVAPDAPAYMAIAANVTCAGADALIRSWGASGPQTRIACYRLCDSDPKCLFFAHLPTPGGGGDPPGRCDIYRACVKQEPVPPGVAALLYRLPREVGEGSRVEYEIEAGVVRETPAAGSGGAGVSKAEADEAEELPVTGVPVPGVVEAGQYQRYRVSVDSAGRHLTVSLALKSGDADLYLGLEASVTRETSSMRSETYGSDSLFVPAFGELNSKHCSEAIIERSRECVYFVAVRGVGRRAEFEISARVPSGVPVLLRPGQSLPLAISPGGWQYFFVEVAFPMQRMTLQVTEQTGKVTDVHVKVTPAAEARHPGAELVELRNRSDLQGMRFAGVWSVDLEEGGLSKLCRAVKEGSGCAAFVAIESKSGVVGEATLEVHASPGDIARGGGDDSKVFATMLHGGLPARGALNGSKDILCFGLQVPDKSSDIAVIVTPLTNCTPYLQLEFPLIQAEDGSYPNRTIWPLSVDPQLNFISTVVSRSAPEFRTGIFLLWVRESGEEACEVDVRAELAAAPGSEGTFGGASPTTMLLDVPVYGSADSDRYFVYTSRIDAAADAPQRNLLEVAVTLLAGEVQVAVAFLVDGDGGAGTKEQRLAKALSTMQVLPPEETRGAPRLYAARGFHERCGAALACQVLVRVRSTRPSRLADFLVVVSDRASRSEVLLPGIPVRSCVGKPCPRDDRGGLPARYQLFINNPSENVLLRLSCQGSGRVEACRRAVLSADTRSLFPASLAARAYAPSADGQSAGVLEVPVSLKAGVAGSCHVPCVLYIRVEVKPGVPPEDSAVEFELVATSRRMYALLLDGDQPVSATVQGTQYFLFDSRRASPLMTLIANVPYDQGDPQCSLVSMYVLDCARQTGLRWECHVYSDVESRMDVSSPDAQRTVCELDRGDGFVYRFSGGNNTKYPGCQDKCTCCRRRTDRGVEEARSPSKRPSAQNFRYKAAPNSRGQLVALVTRGEGETATEGDHCYYRIAVESHRIAPTAITIRGFDYHPGTALPIGEPLEGVADASHRFSYELEDLGPSGSGRVVLSLETCIGNPQLVTAAHGPEATAAGQGGVSLKLKGSVTARDVPFQENRWLEVSASDGKFASYILTAEEPGRRMWLEPRPGRAIRVEEAGPRSLVLVWSAAKLFGRGQPSGGRGGDGDPVAEYEVFYIRSDKAEANLSAPCGLYWEHKRRRARRVYMKTQRRLLIEDLEPGLGYTFNVVARSPQTGLSTAYAPSTAFIAPAAGAAATALKGRASFWDRAVPLSLLCAAAALVCWLRPGFCRGTDGRALFDLELSSRSARGYSRFGGDGGGYLPPAMVGVGDDGDSGRYGQLR